MPFFGGGGSGGGGIAGTSSMVFTPVPDEPTMLLLPSRIGQFARNDDTGSVWQQIYAPATSIASWTLIGQSGQTLNYLAWSDGNTVTWIDGAGDEVTWKAA